MRSALFQAEVLEERTLPTVHPLGEIPHHIHVHLAIFINDVNTPIPASIGHAFPGPILGTADENVHTHTTDGIIHMGEDPNRHDFVKLSEFFDTWGGLFNSNELLLPNGDSTFTDKVVDANHLIRFYVNGAPNSEFQNYEPEDGDEIIISYEPSPSLGQPTLNPINNITMPAGKTFQVPLDGLDPNGSPLSYSFISSNPQLTGLIPTGNPSLQMNVSGKDIEGNNFSGSLTFQLYQDLAPKTVARIVGLVNSGFYNGLTFHRVINDFVAQGGDPLGNGTGGMANSLVPLASSLVGRFDDEFTTQLTFTGVGQLAMANSGDDTNDSQFFITDSNLSLSFASTSTNETPPQHLNFNHTIFGQLTSGFATFNKIMLTPVSSSTPITPVIINSASLVTDPQHAVLRLSAAANFTGSASITVQATNSNSLSVQRTFLATVVSDTINDRPFLGPVTSLFTPENTPLEWPIPTTDMENDPLTFFIFDPNFLGVAPANLQVAINGVTHLATLTPAENFTGTIRMLVGVRDSTNRGGQLIDQYDTQIVTLSVALPSSLQFSAPTYPGKEGISTAIITVTRTGDKSGPLSVDYATSDGTATSGLDYTAAVGTLNFAAGETLKTLIIPILDDSLIEGNETVHWTLSNPTGGASLGSLNTATLTLTDNDTEQKSLFQDSDGDLVSVLLSGSGTISVAQLNPDANGRGSIDQILLSGSGLTSSLTIKVKRFVNKANAANSGDGFVKIGSIVGSADLKSISGKAADLDGTGINLGGWLGSLTLHDILSGADVIAGGNATQSTKIIAHVIGDGTTMDLDSALNSIAVARLGAGSILAPTLGTLTIKGDTKNSIIGDLLSDITLSGNNVAAGKNTLNKLSVAHAIIGATISVTGGVGGIGSVTAAQMIDSSLRAGFTPTTLNDPMSGGTFLPGLFVKTVNIKGIGSEGFAYINSVIGAATIGSVKLESFITGLEGNAFGVIADVAITKVTAPLQDFSWDPTGPLDQNPPATNFHVKLIG